MEQMKNGSKRKNPLHQSYPDRGEDGPGREDKPRAISSNHRFAVVAIAIIAAAHVEEGRNFTSFKRRQTSQSFRPVFRRDRGEAFDAVMTNFAAGTGLSKNGDGSPRNMNADAKNPHPTVKPTELMRYLCRLVTPPGGLIVDPFAGSGSTGKAAILEGFQFVGFELDPQYTAIANARLEAARNAAG